MPNPGATQAVTSVRNPGYVGPVFPGEASAFPMDLRALICSDSLRPFLLLAGLALALPGGAGAQSIDAARAAYSEGRFADAARIAAALGTSDGYALAARTLAVHGHFFAPADRRTGLLEEATALAGKAVRADPGNPEAHLRLAQAIGRHAQAIGAFEAAEQGYAEKIREALETALRLDPGSATAHAALGRWHAGMIAAMGSFLARITFGARERDALAHFDEALKRGPGRKAVNLECALGLLTLDGEKYRDRARGLLVRAIAIPARDAHGRIFHRRAVDRLAALGAEGG